MALSSVDDLASDRHERRGSARIAAAVSALRAGWRTGCVAITEPGGVRHEIRGAAPGRHAELVVRHPKAIGRILAAGDIGLADAYVAGEVDSPDLAELLTALGDNFDAMASWLAGNPVIRAWNAIGHALNRNSKAGARRNILAHYDLGNAFYGLWLDRGLNYSSGLFSEPGESLEDAQAAKHAALAHSIDLRRGDSLLEIGCGWGDFARFAATRYEARVTAVTLSAAQHAHASAMVQKAGLGDRVEVLLRDYRDIDGQFDRIASIEMFEAVGERYWPDYFGRLSRRLRSGGRAGLQIITIRDDLFEGYRRRPDFIQMQVFPGGMLPSEARLRQETGRAGLRWTAVRRFGESYADTLAAWARRYDTRAGDVAALGFDRRFDRLWRYYLAYCEAGFRSGRTDVIQLALAHA